MDRVEYEHMARAEDRMWWYRAAHARVIGLLDALLPDRRGPLLDAGCGTGGLLARLAQAGRANLSGLDLEPAALLHARRKTGATLVCGSVAALPYSTHAFAAITSIDVLYHRAVDEQAALAEVRRCLRPGGLLVLNLPAYAWLASSHDRAVHGARRYTRGGARSLLAAAGFTVLRATYWNTLLFPLMVARRKLLPDDGGSDVMEYPALVEHLFGAATGLEHGLIRAGLNLPFGGSVLLVARSDG